MINFLSGQDAIYFDDEMNHLIVFDFSFTLLVIFLNEANCIINNRNIITDRSGKCRKIQRWR